MTSDIRPTKLLLRQKAVCEACGIAESSLHAMVKSKEFPAPIKMSPGRTAWVAAEIAAWIEERSKQRGQADDRPRRRPTRRAIKPQRQHRGAR